MKLVIRMLSFGVIIIYGMPKILDYLKRYNAHRLQQLDAQNDQRTLEGLNVEENTLK